MKVKDMELDFSTKIGDRVKIIGTNKIGTMLDKDQWSEYLTKKGTTLIETDDEILEVKEKKLKESKEKVNQKEAGNKLPSVELKKNLIFGGSFTIEIQTRNKLYPSGRRLMRMIMSLSLNIPGSL